MARNNMKSTRGRTVSRIIERFLPWEFTWMSRIIPHTNTTEIIKTAINNNQTKSSKDRIKCLYAHFFHHQQQKQPNNQSQQNGTPSPNTVGNCLFSSFRGRLRFVGANSWMSSWVWRGAAASWMLSWMWQRHCGW